MAMGMTEDDAGAIWSVTYPNSGVVSFDPAARELNDFGHVHHENWRQYQRYVAADDAGWIYFGIGSTLGQLIAFEPATATATPIVPQEARRHGTGVVYRDKNGKVYGQCSGDRQWYELHRGEAREIDTNVRVDRKEIITGSQGLFHRRFPSGKVIKECDLVTRTLVISDPRSGETRSHHFDYESTGAHIMGLDVAPDRSICGGTAFPMRFFSYNPKNDEFTNRASYGQWNTVSGTKDRFFVGGYGGGFLLEWDPAQEWVATAKNNAASNPRFLTECTPVIHRPHDLLTHPDGKTVILAGTPGYGFTGGGLLIWDRETQSRTLLEHTDLLPQHSTMSLVALPDGQLVGGTTTSAGTGGERKAKTAELYLLELATRHVQWHAPLLGKVNQYSDLCLGRNGQVYGFADQKRFFVFDPATRKVVYEKDTSATFGSTAFHQGPRIFVPGSDGEIYILFVKGVARLNQETFEIALFANAPVPVQAGGAYLDGRIYFASAADLYSVAVP
jgi:hypothetical protein